MTHTAITIAGSLAALSLTALAAPPAGELPDWLSGEWCTGEAGPVRTCERWSGAAGGMMIGTSQTVKDGRTVGFEFLRITREGETTVYTAQPGGGVPTVFRGRSNAASLTVLAPANDYPQRIRYWREGAALMAEIALGDGTRAQRWRYTRK